MTRGRFWILKLSAFGLVALSAGALAAWEFKHDAWLDNWAAKHEPGSDLDQPVNKPCSHAVGGVL